ncbi:hypothetical protein R1flu_020351 [Riccia fluitans]|uniref:Threonine/serine exporter-like N-terminal domain-containing protein n=1 Tax=Riccia fluitans TaxID=41844 RepID=A0ABD1ZL97_9MARC
MERRLSRSAHDGGSEAFEGLLGGNGSSSSQEGKKGSHFREVEASEGTRVMKRRFLRRLAIALVAYGSSSPRAEYLVARAGERLHEKLNISIFYSAILLVFPGSGDPCRDETYLDRVEVDTDVAKLQQVDEIANGVGLPSTPLSDAYRRLSSVARKESPFGSWSTLLGYTITAPTAALLFFDGGIWDAAFSLLLGFVVGLLSLYSSSLTALGDILEFVSAIFVSFTARLISEYFQHLGVCFFSMALSGLVWLLPGEGLTVGVSEVVEASLVTGASRIIRALVASLQLGFGLVVGEKIMFWGKSSVKEQCKPVQLSQWWDVLWLLAFSSAVNVLLRARPWQWPGMIVTAAAGVLINDLTESFGKEISAVLASFAIELTANLYSDFSRDIPLSMTLSGIQVLLPGGLGVQGVEAMMKHDVLSGVNFVIAMINISLSITLGLLLAKVFVGDTLFSAFRSSRKTLASSLEDDERWEESKENEEAEDEQIAI